MAAEDSDDRTERATPKRLDEARKKGQIARSRELNTVAILLSSAGALLIFGGGLVSRIADIMVRGLSLDRNVVFDPAAGPALFGHEVMQGLFACVPFFAVTVVAAVAASVALGGWSFSTEAMAFKFDKLDPVAGLKRLFAWRGVVELIKALIKFLLVGFFAVLMLDHLRGELLSLGYEAPRAALAHAGEMIGWVFLKLSLTLILVAAADVPYQVWDHARQMRMSKQEIKDEYKDTEGKPEVKAHIRNMQRELAQRRMMAEVPHADVVVTNPTHFAVALRYEQGMRAPRLVAKGQDLIAAQIRSVALASEVPIISAPPLARALYRSTELDAEIPAGLYLAVAQVLAYVFQLKAVRAHGGAAPPPPTDLDVPPEYERGERPH